MIDRQAALRTQHPIIDLRCLDGRHEARWRSGHNPCWRVACRPSASQRSSQAPLRFSFVGPQSISPSGANISCRPGHEFLSQPNPGAAQKSISPHFLNSFSLMNANDGPIDHRHVSVVEFDNGAHQSIPDSSLTPAVELVINSRAWTMALRAIDAGHAGSQHQKHTVQNPPVVDSRKPTWLIGKMRHNRLSFKVRQLLASHVEAPSK